MTTTIITVAKFFDLNKCVNVASLTSGFEVVAVKCQCGRWIDGETSAEGCTVKTVDGEPEMVCRRCSE